MEIAATPDVSHKDVLARLHEGKKPFRQENHDVGYRDYLIWRTILAIASDCATYFVTNNSRDFEGNTPNELHADLQADLDGRPVHLFRDLHQVYQAHIEPLLARDERFHAWFDEWLLSGSFIDFAEEALPDSLFDSSLILEWDVPPELDEMEPQRIVDVSAIVTDVLPATILDEH